MCCNTLSSSSRKTLVYFVSVFDSLIHAQTWMRSLSRCGRSCKTIHCLQKHTWIQFSHLLLDLALCSPMCFISINSLDTVVSPYSDCNRFKALGMFSLCNFSQNKGSAKKSKEDDSHLISFLRIKHFSKSSSVFWACQFIHWMVHPPSKNFWL